MQLGINGNERAAERRLRIALVNPKFEPHFYGLDYALPLFPGDKRAVMPNGAIPILAALAAGHEIVAFDENVAPLDVAVLGGFDIVGVTGMIVQSRRIREILAALRPYSCLAVVGGPLVSVDEGFCEDLADVIFIGEAEETWPAFLHDYACGKPIAARYEQAEKTDMSTVPVPRYDVSDSRRYMFAPLQFSRGCPFMCEFCDIIVMFGRRPRFKSTQQMIAEIEATMAAGYRTIFLVDDNFIGNKKAARDLLIELVRWQKERNYPVNFSTEATIDLADQPELLRLMREAGFSSVFFGLESPRKASLEETKKVQNVRGDSLSAKLDRVRDAGLIATAGFIVGFDNDDASIFAEQHKFIEENSIALAGVTMLSAIPSTPLYKRLEMEGRLVDDPDCNFEPRNMTRAELKAGFQALNAALFTPDAYMNRIFQNMRKSQRFLDHRIEVRRRQRQNNRWAPVTDMIGALITLRRLVATCLKAGAVRSVLVPYVRLYVAGNLPIGRGRLTFSEYVRGCARHWHHFVLANEISAGRAYSNSYNFDRSRALDAGLLEANRSGGEPERGAAAVTF